MIRTCIAIRKMRMSQGFAFASTWRRRHGGKIGETDVVSAPTRSARAAAPRLSVHRRTRACHRRHPSSRNGHIRAQRRQHVPSLRAGGRRSGGDRDGGVPSDRHAQDRHAAQHAAERPPPGRRRPRRARALSWRRARRAIDDASVRRQNGCVRVGEAVPPPLARRGAAAAPRVVPDRVRLRHLCRRLRLRPSAA